jgi:hypothetical protein
MIRTIGSVPVKTRVPLAAWAFAGLLTLLSTFSSLLQAVVGPDFTPAASEQATNLAREARHASVNW